MRVPGQLASLRSGDGRQREERERRREGENEDVQDAAPAFTTSSQVRLKSDATTSSVSCHLEASPARTWGEKKEASSSFQKVFHLKTIKEFVNIFLKPPQGVTWVAS